MPEGERPAICLENSEVFETSDLPESDQYYFPVEESDTVETLHVTTNQAFSRFKGSVVSNSSVDFSDTIRNSRRKGYIVWTGEEKTSEQETPVKKYQRLNCEIRELLDELKEARGNKDIELDAASVERLSYQVEVLHKCLLEMRVEDVLGSEALASMTDPQVSMRDKLSSEIKQIKNLHIDQHSSDQMNTQQTAKQLNYSLLMKPDQQKLQSNAEMSSLVDRVDALERSVGVNNTEDLQIISIDTGRKNLVDAISVLSSKATILEPRNLDHIEGRLALLIQRMKDEGINEQSSDLTSDERSAVLDKVEHLDKLMTKSNSHLQNIPEVIQRMEALNPLHSQASSLNQGIIQLEIAQKQLLTQTCNNSTLLKEIEKKMQDNLSRIENNFDSLQARINQVKANQKK